ncbi:uncharacterized protein LOC125381112 [Haliotis rufescens]|uniref:uncharacterized protein LOC125381112 n=1 Tax=Haliotis rufescens TaxID=6454 RepID=UPI00201ECD1E|nr:uncharacterized protein LOC125381112 [Haliotis rufescens]
MEHQEEAGGQDKDTIEMPETYRYTKRRQTQAKKPTLVKNHHKGPMPTTFVTDARKKSNTLCSRKRTLMKKVDELVSRTHSEAYLHIFKPSKQNWSYGSHELKSKYDKLLMKQHGPMETQGIPAQTTSDDVVTVPFPSLLPLT